MKRKLLAAVAGAMFLSCGAASADQGPIPTGVPHLDHVWVIMMENEPFSAEVGNPDVPYINHLYQTANVATNYYGVGHPSFTNYIELLGGSNFGIRSDRTPAWHSTNCVSTLTQAGQIFDGGLADGTQTAAATDCPISGSGMDAATPAYDWTNEHWPAITDPAQQTVQNATWSMDSFNPATGKPWGLHDDLYASAPTLGISIADQLMAARKTWKSYQQSLPMQGANNVDYSDGVFVNDNDSGADSVTGAPGVLSQPTKAGTMVQLYAVKHDPFVYFKSIQDGPGLKNIVGFGGSRGLFADLRTGDVPNFSFIAPNQCNDQHGRGNSTADCTGAALMHNGDVMVHKLIDAIKASPAWKRGHNAIVVTWDENDYGTNEANKVLTMVVNNRPGPRIVDSTIYNHFSLLRTIEGGLGLPCLNHACDASTATMGAMFGAADRDDDGFGRGHERR